MSLEEIASVIASTATVLKAPVQGLVNRALIDAYKSLKIRLTASSENKTEVESAFVALEKKPVSVGRRMTLLEELEENDVSISEELLAMVSELKVLLENHKGEILHAQISVNQSGKGNTVKIAGRDLIETKKIVRRNEIKTDERHINGKQALKISQLIETIANMLLTEGGKPNFKAAYGKLYYHMDVTSYKEILTEDFDEAVSFLKQLAAQNRPKLKKSNPKAYAVSMFAAIYAKWGELGHEKKEIYEYVERHPKIGKRVRSLKQLGPNQLKWLNESLNSEISKARNKNR